MAIVAAAMAQGMRVMRGVRGFWAVVPVVAEAVACFFFLVDAAN